MIATSLSTQSCPTGLCGQCGPCRREMREADRLMRPKTLPPIELSPTVQQLLAEDRKRTRPTRRPIPKVANRRAATPTAIPTSNQACTQCGELRGYRTIGSKATTHILDGEGTLCQVCADHPRIQATITRLENKPGPRTKSETTPPLQITIPHPTNHQKRQTIPPQRQPRLRQRIRLLPLPMRRMPRLARRTRPRSESQKTMTHTLTIIDTAHPGRPPLTMNEWRNAHWTKKSKARTRIHWQIRQALQTNPIPMCGTSNHQHHPIRTRRPHPRRRRPQRIPQRRHRRTPPTRHPRRRPKACD